MEKELYERRIYLDRIRPFKNSCEIIKVLTGVRRAGKSSVMDLVRRELKRDGVADSNIIYINLDAKENIGIVTKAKLIRKIDSLAKNITGIKYLFIDEIQNVKGFELVINAYREEGDYSIFITGSNGYLLSGKLATKLTGRYIEFHIGTLIFSEYLEMKERFGKQLSSDEKEFEEYVLCGGFPGALEFDSQEAKKEYAQNIIEEIFKKDILTNKKIRDWSLFNQIQNYTINNFGATFSAKSLTTRLSKSHGVNHSYKTIYNYLSILEEAKIIQKCQRFDLKSKKSLNGEEKYYLTDLAFYFATNTDNRINYGPVLENLIYNYAKAFGYQTSIGKIGNLEVDFIMRSRSNDYSYVQVAKTLDDGNYDERGVPKVEEREYKPLEKIKDNYPKYVLTMDKLLQRRNGIINENIIEFFKKEGTF